MRKMGEDEYKRLSEKERQRLLMQMKLRERQLRRDGKYHTMIRLSFTYIFCIPTAFYIFIFTVDHILYDATI